jgi:hypothetical protein
VQLPEKYLALAALKFDAKILNPNEDRRGLINPHPVLDAMTRMRVLTGWQP